MTNKETAYFVRHPRRLEELLTIYPLSLEKPYEIRKTVSLSGLAYKNFISDFLADRDFLEGIPESKGTLLCVFVHRWGRKDGILVVPTRDGHVALAAYCIPV